MPQHYRDASHSRPASAPRLKERRARPVAATALALGLAGLLLGGLLNGCTKPTPGGEVTDKPPVVKEGDLLLHAYRQGSGYELRVGQGRALLTLDPPTLVAPDPEAGARFVDALVKALGVAPPIKFHTTPLAGC